MSPLRGPETATGGASGGSQTGTEQRPYLPPKGTIILGPASGFLSSPTPSGGDDTAALQSWINSASSNVGILLPGTYKVSGTILMPASTYITGVNRRSTNIEATANNYIFAPVAGDNFITEIGFRAAGKQAGTGGVIDFSQGFSDNFWMEHCEVGSNFFQAFKVVGGNGEIGNLNWNDIFVHEPAGGAGGHSQAVWKFGGVENTERVAVVRMNNIEGTSVTGAEEIPLWIAAVNTDSLHVANYGFQFGKRGIRLGQGDTSEKKVTGAKFHLGFVDTMAEGGLTLESEIRDILFTASSMQGCGEGIFVGTGVRTFRYQDGAVQSSELNGIRLAAGLLGALISGCHITDNNRKGEAEGAKIAGVKAEAAASNWALWNNFIGGMNAFSAKQQLGVFVAKGASNFYSIFGNRIPEKGAGPAENTVKAILDEGEGATKLVSNNLLG